MNIKIVLGSLCASFSTWEQMFFHGTASVPDTLVFVTRFSPGAVYGASIICMKWDLKLKNVYTMVAIRSSDAVLFFTMMKTVENQVLFFFYWPQLLLRSYADKTKLKTASVYKLA